jgi:ammonium transporter Rh
MGIGFSAGVISTLGFMFLSPKLESKIGLYDSCGVHNLHGIPGIFGAVVSAIIVAFYQTGYDRDVAANYGPNSIFAIAPDSYLHQGGLQIAGMFLSIGMAITFGILAGLILRKLYN